MSKLFVTSLSLLLVVFVSTAYAGSEALTFDEFYSKGIPIWFWITGISFALVAIGVAILSGGIAGPVMTAIGGWIGGLYGLTGAAATNFGLALLGGGAVAAGGFGMAGGVVVLTALFEFTVFGGAYAVEKIAISFEEARFIEQSKHLSVLPLPLKASASKAYEQAVQYLGKHYRKHELHSSQHNQQILSHAITTLETNGIFQAKDLQGMVLLALLHHQRGGPDDCRKCRDLSNSVLHSARSKGLAPKDLTLPLALRAICSLGMAGQKSGEIVDDFLRASDMEKKKDLIVIAAAVFADRLIMRDDLVNGADLARLVRSADQIAGRKHKDTYALVFLMRNNLKLNEYWSVLKFFSDNAGNNEVVHKRKNMQNCAVVYRKYGDLIKECPEMAAAVRTIKPEIIGTSKDLKESKKLISDLRGSFAKHGRNKADAEKYFSNFKTAYDNKGTVMSPAREQPRGTIPWWRRLLLSE